MSHLTTMRFWRKEFTLGGQEDFSTLETLNGKLREVSTLQKARESCCLETEASLWWWHHGDYFRAGGRAPCSGALRYSHLVIPQTLWQHVETIAVCRQCYKHFPYLKMSKLRHREACPIKKPDSEILGLCGLTPELPGAMSFSRSWRLPHLQLYLGG